VSQDDGDAPAVPAGASPLTAEAGPADIPADTTAQPPGPVLEPAPEQAPRQVTRLRPWPREVLVLAGFLAAGVLVTWPRATYLTGRLPFNTDQAEYVWNMWWVAHQVTHLGNPWSTSYLAAPVGIQLGFDTLTPLLGLVMTPVTLLFGPSASYNLLAILIPGLAGYAMHRAARLWLPPLGSVAAGAFFGLSGALAFQVWFHEHTAAGCIFLPLALEAAVRLRRRPAIRTGVFLGVVLGASMLVDQELALLVVGVAVLALAGWLLRGPGAAGLRGTVVAAVTAVVVASPQLASMAQGLSQGHANPAPDEYVKFAGELPSLFAPSPRLAQYGFTGLAHIYHQHTPTEALATFGTVLTILGLIGLAVGWRRHGTKALGLLWAACAILALGPTIDIAGHQFAPLPVNVGGTRMSLLMPYTWMTRLPGLASFREADRFTLLGLVAAAVLGGAAVEWLFRKWRPLLAAVVLLAALEAGWPYPISPTTTTTALPALDRPIAADHSGSLVVDVPFGIYGIPQYGKRPPEFSLVLATEDGHPLADSYTSWVPRETIRGIRGHAFYADLVAARAGRPVTPAMVAAARRDLPGLHVGWVLVWPRRWMQGTRKADYPAILHFLAETGFHYDYKASGVTVYRPAP
jgi:hypothetical protein